MLQKKLSWINVQIERGHEFEKQMGLEKSTLEKQSSDIELRMREKHKSLKDELDGVLKKNVERLKSHQKSQMNVIDKELNDAEQHVFLLEKNLNEAAKCQPAQALILLQSLRTSLEEDLFKTYKVIKPDLVERKLMFADRKPRFDSDLFGKLHFSNGSSGSSSDKEKFPKQIIDMINLFTRVSRFGYWIGGSAR